MTEHPSKPTQPALQALRADQDRAEANLYSGFTSLRDVVEWTVDVAVSTLGMLPDWWFVDVTSDDYLLTVLLTGPERKLHDADPIALDKAADERRQLAADWLLPAFLAAYRELRKSAGEYVEEGDADQVPRDPDRQRWTAMRPGYDELRTLLADLLDELWQGFADETAVLDWLHRLQEATHGEIAVGFENAHGDLADDVDWVTLVYHDDHAIERLTAPSDDLQSARWREWFAGTCVLPGANAGVRARSPGESASVEATNRNVPHG